VACTYCGFCGYGFGCWNNSKSSALVTLIAEAEKTGRLEIRENSRVMKILSDSSGRVTGVKYRGPGGKMFEQRAKFVILGGYVYENSRMLLLSKSDAYRHGLSNNNGQVGKYYRAQVVTSISGLYPGEDLNLWQGTSGQTFTMDDFNGDNFDHHGLGFIRGANIQAGTNNMPVAQSAAVAPGVPLWGSEYKQWVHKNAGSIGSLTGQMETLPYEANFIDLDPVKKDDLGVPVARVTFNAYQNEKRMAAFLTKKITAVHRAAGATKTWGGLGVTPIYSHAYGGTRMGEDPATSVVDLHSISHEARNLAIMGGSTFPSVTGYNPTLTMQALTWFGADFIAKNFDSLAA
jgi:gluconate 2-dehydrogenase alpha chain